MNKITPNRVRAMKVLAARGWSLKQGWPLCTAIAELAEVVASARQLGDHCVERLLIEGQAITVALAAD